MYCFNKKISFSADFRSIGKAEVWCTTAIEPFIHFNVNPYKTIQKPAALHDAGSVAYFHND
ncbi:hypothetical protein BSBH6_01777 [Bacillus subtilis]|nr:hypothetical protein CJ481_14855 [Bacillus subtilis]RPK05076.1 hypothetical protein BSBH6_01777 [Bacillus subtilis]RPK25500.1 hypothetical protein BH5_02332 [Bacillus subtilis]